MPRCRPSPRPSLPSPNRANRRQHAVRKSPSPLRSVRGPAKTGHDVDRPPANAGHDACHSPARSGRTLDRSTDRQRLVPVTPSCTAVPIRPSAIHAIGTHCAPDAGVNGYRIHTSDAARAAPRSTSASPPRMIVHAPRKRGADDDHVALQDQRRHRPGNRQQQDDEHGRLGRRQPGPRRRARSARQGPRRRARCRGNRRRRTRPTRASPPTSAATSIPAALLLPIVELAR